MTTTEQSKTDAAKRAVADVKDAVSDQGHQLTSTTTEQARAMTDEVRAQAGSVIDDARGEIESQLESQAQRVGAALHDAHRQVASMASTAEPGLVSSITQQLADSLGSAADRIEDGGVRAVADDVRSFARRQPALFLIGAGALGFLAARVFRANTSGSSEARRVESTSESYPTESPNDGHRPGALDRGRESGASIAATTPPSAGVHGGTA